MQPNALLATLLASTRADAVLTVYCDGEYPVLSRELAAHRRQAGADQRVWIAQHRRTSKRRWAPYCRLTKCAHDIGLSRAAIALGPSAVRLPVISGASPLGLGFCGHFLTGGGVETARHSGSEQADRMAAPFERADAKSSEVTMTHCALTHETTARPMASSWPVGQSAFIHRAPRRLVAPARGVANPFASAGPKVLRCISFSNC